MSAEPPKKNDPDPNGSASIVGIVVFIVGVPLLALYFGGFNAWMGALLGIGLFGIVVRFISRG